MTDSSRGLGAMSAHRTFESYLSAIRRMPADAAEEIVADAQRKGDLIGVRMSIADDEGAQDPWTLPPSRKRRERPIEGPLPRSVQIVRANLVYVDGKIYHQQC